MFLCLTALSLLRVLWLVRRDDSGAAQVAVVLLFTCVEGFAGDDAVDFCDFMVSAHF